jgi:hypothetical protein
MEKQVDDPGAQCRWLPEKQKKTVPSPEEKEEKKRQKGDALRRRLQERRLYDEMVVEACFLHYIGDP